MVKDSGATVRADRLRPLNTPRPLHVEADERGRPVVVGLGGREAGVRGQKDTGARRHGDTAKGDDLELRRVEEILDRWRIDDEWWRKEVSRIYYHVALEGGQLLTLFRDLTTGHWYGQTSATPLPAEGAKPIGIQAFGLPSAAPELRIDSTSAWRAG